MATLSDPCVFARHASGLTLRNYQSPVAQTICNSVIRNLGRTFVVMFPRQSGKNELQAQIETYLLLLLSETNADIVKISPTFKPQTLNAMRRLERVLKKNLITFNMWSKESGYIYRVGLAHISFFSGNPEANIVGATASTLLEVDEAQDIDISKFDKDINPMAASTNATRVFWGTAWTNRTLLARELIAAKAAQDIDGCQRVFSLTADQVALEVSAYGRFVAEQISLLGRNHPMIKTQYFCETIDNESGMFPGNRQALMQGDHPNQTSPTPGAIYAFLIDIAGQDENSTDPNIPTSLLSNPRRDSTVLTIVQVDLSTLANPLIKRPTYRVVFRSVWTGANQTVQYSKIAALAEAWRPRHIIVDSTGIGAGLASFLDKSLPGRVIPFLFTSSSKSKLGWDFLACVETGRYKDYKPFDKLMQQQLTYCQMETRPGPGHLISWSVPDGTHDPATGDLVHDDLVMSAALVAVLDEQEWAVAGPSLIVHALDPLGEMDKGY